MNGAVRSFVAAIGLMLGPIIVFGIHKLRRYARGAQQAERDALPYDPKPQAQPGVLLHRFSPPQQKYLRLILGSACYLFPALGWLTFGILSLPIFDPRFHNTWNDPLAFLWFRMVLGATTFVGTSCFIFGMVTATLVMSGLRFGTTAQFFRTRPLGIGFLFWTNLLVSLGTLLAAIFTGIGASLLLLVATHGPIWRHLPPVFPGVVTAHDDRPELYASLLATSPPHIFLSIATTTALILGLFSVLLAFPYSLRGKRSSLPNTFPALAVAFGMCGWLALRLVVDVIGVHLPSWLFLYSELGPPPPYAFTLIPAALSAGLLLLARYFVGKSEV
jgi:hypothetical protein